MFYAKLFATNRGKYLYDTMSNKMIIIPESIYEYLSSDNAVNISNGEYLEYIDRNQIRDVRIEPHNFHIGHNWSEDSVIRRINSHRKLLILSITNKCNMNCTYCVYHTKFNEFESKDHSMSFETARKAIDEALLYSENIDNLHIGFYGGESLIEFNLIQECVKHAQKNSCGTKLSFGMTTNGLMLNNPTIKRFLENHNFQVVISLDGPQILNDRYRIDKAGDGAYSRVIENIKKWYKETPAYVKDKIVINAVKAPPIYMKALDDYFKDFPIDYQLNDMIETQYFTENINLHSNVYLNKLRFDSEYAYSDDYYKALWSSFKNYVPTGKGLFNGAIIPGGTCLPVYLRWYVNSKGEYYPCERIEESEEFCIGNVDDGVDYKKIISLYDKYISIAKQKCKGCWAMRLCQRCFKNISDDCKETKLAIEKKMTYYIENIINNKDAQRIIDETMYSVI